MAQAQFPDAPVVRSAVTARSWFDYRHMFNLDDTTLSRGPILDCPAGASSFAAQARARGGTVTSVDPIYTEPAASIRQRVAANLDHAGPWLQARTATINWSYLGSVAAHRRASDIAADLFAMDYTQRPHHYVAAALPRLPFADHTFALTLSAHLLFAYPEQLILDEHAAALVELVRVTDGEVRIHPLVDTTGPVYPHLAPLRSRLAHHGIRSTLRPATNSWLRTATQTLICERDDTTS